MKSTPNGATAIYDAADSAASQLAFTYTVASGAPYSTQDLRVTGFVGTITDPSGATIDPTSSVVSDTKLVVAANAAIPPTLSITTPSALLKTASLTLSGTIDAADAGQTVSIYDGSTLLGTVAPAAGGAWSTTVTLSGGGVHMLTAQAGSPGLVGTSSAVTYVLAPGPISVAQALSFETAGLVAPVGAAFTLADTAADLGALTASQIAGLATLGVTRLVATDIDLTFSSAQTSALAAAGISLSEPGAQVWTWRVDGSYDILYSGVAGQIYTSYDAFFNADGSRRDTHYYGITGQGFSDYDVVFASGAVSDVHYYGVTGAPFDNYDVIYGAGGAKTSEAWYIGSALYQTEGFNADGSAHDIRYYGITGQAFTNFDEIYGAGGVVHDIFYHHITGLPFSDYDVVYNADGTKHDIHYYGVTGQAYADYDVVFNADGTTHDIRYNNLTGQAFTSFDVTYGAGGVVNDIHYYGVTGQPFTDYDVVYAPGWVLTSETWNNGASPYQAEVWFADGGYSIQYDGLTGSETAEQDDYGPGAALMAIGGDMADGSGRLALYGSGLTVTRTAGALSVQSGPDVYTLDPHAVEKIIEVGASETYIFHAGFGATSINGFGASGAGHDTLQLDVSGFSYLTAGMTQAQDLAAVLAHATTSGNGANLVIADTAATPDTLTLLGVTSATINANPAAVKFV